MVHGRDSMKTLPQIVLTERLVELRTNAWISGIQLVSEATLGGLSKSFTERGRGLREMYRASGIP